MVLIVLVLFCFVLCFICFCVLKSGEISPHGWELPLGWWARGQGGHPDKHLSHPSGPSWTGQWWGFGSEGVCQPHWWYKRSLRFFFFKLPPFPFTIYRHHFQFIFWHCGIFGLLGVQPFEGVTGRIMVINLASSMLFCHAPPHIRYGFLNGMKHTGWWNSSSNPKNTIAASFWWLAHGWPA